MQTEEFIAPKEIDLTDELVVNFIDKVARRLVLNYFKNITEGEVTVVEKNERMVFGNATSEFPIKATVNVQSPKMFLDIAAKGLNGAGEAYIKGRWTCDDLTALVRIFTRNRDAANNMEGGLATLGVWGFKLAHALKKNNRQGSWKNIHAHYDLGNEFFSTFLDETKMYSCGIFEKPESSLYEASVDKIDRICKKMNLSAKDHVVEIGTGWGGFALHAAKKYGCRVTTTTISDEQFLFAKKLMKENEIDDLVTVLKQDYRDLEGQFDKLVSIEMIEAVGYQYYKTFFEKCSQLLKPNGRMMIQAIIIVDNLFNEAKDFVDFIKQYIFPGSCIPSITALCSAAASSSDIRLFHLEDITPHYARTLKEWRERFLQNKNEVENLGFSEAFIRMWIFYLCYCEGGFIERQIGNVQMLFTKPLCRMDPILPSIEN